MSTSNTHFDPRLDELEAVPFLCLLYQLIAVDIQKATNDLGHTSSIDMLNINLNELQKAILVQIQNEIVDEVKNISHNNERELVCKLCLLEEVL